MRRDLNFCSRCCFSLALALGGMLILTLRAEAGPIVDCAPKGDSGNRYCPIDGKCALGQVCRKILAPLSGSCDCVCTYSSEAQCTLPDLP